MGGREATGDKPASFCKQMIGPEVIRRSIRVPSSGEIYDPRISGLL